MTQIMVAAIKDENTCKQAIESKAKTVFVLKGDICDINEIVEMCHEANKTVFLHIEMMDGFGKDEAALKFIATKIKPDGIITTKATLAKCAKTLGLRVVFRVFLIDSSSINSAIMNIKRCNPDYVEILPGLIPELIDAVGQKVNCKMIAGGLISKEEHVREAFKYNIIACSTSESKLWNMEI